MNDTRELLERVGGRFAFPDEAFERLERRRDRKRRNRRVGAGALAIILALVSFVAVTRAFRTVELPADEPTPKPQGIFSEVGGWIVYGPMFEKCEPSPCGHEEGIWAVDPDAPGRPEQSDSAEHEERDPAGVVERRLEVAHPADPQRPPPRLHRQQPLRVEPGRNRDAVDGG